MPGTQWHHYDIMYDNIMMTCVKPVYSLCVGDVMTSCMIRWGWHHHNVVTSQTYWEHTTFQYTNIMLCMIQWCMCTGTLWLINVPNYQVHNVRLVSGCFLSGMWNHLFNMWVTISAHQVRVVMSEVYPPRAEEHEMDTLASILGYPRDISPVVLWSLYLVADMMTTLLEEDEVFGYTGFSFNTHLLMQIVTVMQLIAVLFAIIVGNT